MKGSTLLALALLLIAPAASAMSVRFLVAEPEGERAHGDSYVLTLEDPDAIAHARDLIAQGPSAGMPIVVARIAAGSDGINRDLLAAGEPLWSWHVTEFEQFADITIEILDGWPSFVEQDVGGWIANTGGRIGFWSYTVVQELETVPEPATAALLGGALAGLASFHRWRRRARKHPRARPRAYRRSS